MLFKVLLPIEDKDDSDNLNCRKEHGGKSQTYYCVTCQQSLSTWRIFKRHNLEKHVPKGRFQCSRCNFKTNRNETLSRHFVAKHGGGLIVSSLLNDIIQNVSNSVESDWCGRSFSQDDMQDCDSVEEIMEPRRLWNIIRYLHMELVQKSTCVKHVVRPMPTNWSLKDMKLKVDRYLFSVKGQWRDPPETSSLKLS